MTHKVNWKIVNEMVGEPFHCPACGKPFDQLLKYAKRGSVMLAVLTHEGISDCMGDDVAWQVKVDDCCQVFDVSAVGWMYRTREFFYEDNQELWDWMRKKQ